MKAKFIGTTSMGFKKGQVYDIRTKVEELHYNGYDIKCICVYDNYSKAWCPYKNLEFVLENWEF